MIDEADKVAFQRRLNKVVGQCKGILRMIKSKSPCTDTLLQVSAAKNALHQLGQLLLDDYIAEAVQKAIAAADPACFSEQFNQGIRSFCQTNRDIALINEGTFEERIETIIASCDVIGQAIAKNDASRTEVLALILQTKNNLHAFGQFLLETFVAKCVKTAIDRKTAGVFAKDFRSAIESFCRMRK